jgi:hypothetical protein
MYIRRVLLAKWVIPITERIGIKDLGEWFTRVQDTWLYKATYSLMNYVLSLLLYNRKIAQETNSRLMVSWSKQGKLMYFIRKLIPIDDIRSMVAEMTADIKNLL